MLLAPVLFRGGFLWKALERSDQSLGKEVKINASGDRRLTKLSEEFRVIKGFKQKPQEIKNLCKRSWWAFSNWKASLTAIKCGHLRWCAIMGLAFPQESWEMVVIWSCNRKWTFGDFRCHSLLIWIYDCPPIGQMSNWISTHRAFAELIRLKDYEFSARGDIKSGLWPIQISKGISFWRGFICLRRR